QTISAEAALYETCYVTSHKSACRVATFHPTGQLIATGSEDTSIKILDVERMLAKSATPPEVIAQETPQQAMENHPVIRTLYDHAGEISTLDFHPHHQILVSGSKDHSVRFFERLQKLGLWHSTQAETSYWSEQVSQHVSVLLEIIVRMYDVKTFSCYVGRNPNDQHTAAVTCAKYSPNANLYTSCSKDGNIKVWDSVSGLCINTFKNAHDGEEVCSVQFTRNSKYILSSGKDSMVKLWELSTNRCLIIYTGAGTMGKQEHRTKCCFNHTEDYVLFPDEKTTSLCCWDSRNAERQRLLSLGHNGIVRCINHSPTGPAFVTTSDDNRARFWYRKADSD
ncbi:CSTF1-like protein, partial [Mya arenaria]